MRKLKDIIDCSYDLDICGITDDSRDVKPGYLFVATKGFYVDHFDYIEDAIERGAVALICDREISASVPCILVSSNINDVYIQCCRNYYNVVPADFSFIGITGTDGKTTTATIVQRLLDDDTKTAYIGTNGLCVNKEKYSTNNTTPCVSELYYALNLIKNKNCKSVVMEVSSEALLHERLKDFSFDIVGYTNITGDHLNIHKTFDNYRDCKFKLLDLVSSSGIVIYNGDDKNCKLIEGNRMYSYGFSSDNDYVISDVKKMSKFVNFQLECQGHKYYITSPLLGIHNIYNVTLAFIICLLRGIDSKVLLERIKMLRPIDGRGEFLDFGQKYDIILDYAHTTGGIKNILDSVKGYKRIITVTGAAGGREVEKRSEIGKIVLKNSDVTIFTMDDPRFENVDDIIDDLVGDSQEPYFRIVNRKDAITKALDIACSGDVVLILGKGRDSYMAIEDRKVDYSDYDILSEYFSL